MKHSLSLLFVAGLTACTFSRASLGEMPVAPLAFIAADTAQPDAATSSSEDALYAQGTKAMDDQRWADAVSAFDRVASGKGKRADAALYWKAYSLNKLGRKEEAAATCGALHGASPSSRWNRECLALEVRISVDPEKIAAMAREQAEMGINMSRMNMDMNMNMSEFQDGESGVHMRMFKRNGEATEDDIKILALNSLIRQEPAKALPMLRDILRSDKSSIDMKRQALFVLSRSKQPEAQALLSETAKNSKEPALQREAVQMLALDRGKDAGPALVDIYRGSSDPGVKRAAVNGLFLAHDAGRLVELARAEKDLGLKRDIVSQLALMKDPAATDYMLELLK